MGGYQYGRGDSTGDDPRSPGQGGGGRRGYGSAGGGSRGYGSGGAPADGPGAGGYGRQPSPPPQPGGYGSAAGPESYDYDPYGAQPAAPTPGGGGGRRGYGSAGSRARSSDPIPGEVVQPGYPSSAPSSPAGYDVDPSHTRVQDPADDYAVPGPRRSRLEERRAARSGEGAPRDASQARSEQYPESALNGRSTRNGAASRARTGARGARPTGPVRKTGYHRYFDYPRTGKYGWRHWMPSIKQVSGCFLAGFFLLLGLVAFEYETVQIPDEHGSASAQSSFFEYADGSTVFDKEGTTNRTIVQYDQIPLSVQNAVVSQEDKTFWTNPGVSYTGTLRALAVDLMGGSTQGGSTITQQFVKNAYLTQAQTTSRKIDEIFIALKLSKKYDKKTIMADYLNTSPFGRDTSGIAAGAKAWFNLSLADMDKEPLPLQDSQAAFLSAMVNAPSTYSAGWDPTQDQTTRAKAQALCLTRWADTLKNMRQYGYIKTDAEYQQALADKPNPVALSSTTGETIQDAQMKQAALSWLSTYDSTHPDAPTPAQIYTGGYTVVTTFNQQYMQMAQKAMQDGLLSDETTFDKQTLAPGLAAVDPTNGDLVAFYGGTEYENTATMQTVQGGSTFKLFTLATALTNNWSPDSYVSGDPWPDKSNPTEMQEDQGDTSSGITNDGSHDKMGMITVKHALDASVNTAFVRIEEQQPGQYQEVEKMAQSFGLTQSFTGCDNVRFTLGVCAVDPARMADAYSALPDNGTLHNLVEIKEIKGPGIDWKPQDSTSQPVSSNVAATETNMMTGVIHNNDGTANGAYNSGSLRMTNIAGKTGTSTLDYTPSTRAAMQQENYDTHGDTFTTAGIWFDGFSSKLSVSVGISRWDTNASVVVNGQTVKQTVQLPVDNIGGKGINDYGATYPFAVWDSFMQQMQSTPYGGDTPFATPTANPSASVMNSPAPSTAATTASPTNTTPAPTQTTPTAVQTTPTGSTSTTASPTNTCQQWLPGACQSTGPTSSGSASPSGSPSSKHGGGGGGGGGTGG